jgi:hypothetical protein
MLKHITKLLLLVTLISGDNLFGQTPRELKPATIALLYAGNKDPVSGASGFVTSIASWRNYLYASWHDLDQRYYLHIWDLNNPREPKQIDSIYYGQGVDTPSLKFQPKGLSIRNSHLVFNVSNQLVVYPLNSDGKLGAASYYDFNDGLDNNVLVLKHGGEFASSLRKTITDAEYLDVISDPNGPPASALDQYLSAHTLINLRNPKAPFLQRLSRPYGYGYDSYKEPISGTYRDNPYIATLSNNNTSLTLITFREKNRERLSGFWDDKLKFLFKNGALNRPLGWLIKKTIRGLDPKELQGKLIDQYIKSLRINKKKNLGQILTAKWGSDTTIEAILEEFNLSDKDSLRTVISAIAESQISSTTQAALVRQICNKALLD